MMLGVGVIPVAQGYGMDPNECYTGCLTTGAGNCAEICGVPIYKATGTAVTDPTRVCLNVDVNGNCVQYLDQLTSGQLIPGLKNEYLLLAAAALAAIVIVSR